jgi:DNA-binding NarL/FixJ family response regulator
MIQPCDVSDLVFRALQAGYPEEAVLKAVVSGFGLYRDNQNGHTARRLSPREQEIVALMAEGLSNVQIAKRIGVTEKTVKNYVHSIYQTEPTLRPRRNTVAR